MPKVPDSESEAESEPNLEDTETRLTRSEAASKLSISVNKLRTLETLGRIQKATIEKGSLVPTIPASAIEAYLNEHGGSSQETGMAELVRAARDLLAQEQSHGQKMFDKYLTASDKLFDTLTSSVEKQQEHIINLEKQALEMREAADKVFNLEHERKMAEMREARKEAMQAAAIKSVIGVAGPFISKKFGVELPGTNPERESQEQLLGQAVVGMLIQMTDEKFIALKEIVGEEAHTILGGVRMQAKGTP